MADDPPRGPAPLALDALCLGRRVAMSGDRYGRVVAVVDRGEYSIPDGHRWAALTTGVVVRDDDGALSHFRSPHEFLRPLPD